MTRPDIKFSEETESEMKKALETYRDSKENQIHALHEDGIKYSADSDIQGKITQLKSSIIEVAPEWLVKSRDVESELLELAKVMGALHPSEKQYK